MPRGCGGHFSRPAGAGGYGKTTLAKALAHDPDIQDAYFDGILWAELGEKPANLLGVSPT
jgi:hypothetical protein